MVPNRQPHWANVTHQLFLATWTFLNSSVPAGSQFSAQSQFSARLNSQLSLNSQFILNPQLSLNSLNSQLSAQSQPSGQSQIAIEVKYSVTEPVLSAFAFFRARAKRAYLYLTVGIGGRRLYFPEYISILQRTHAFPNNTHFSCV